MSPAREGAATDERPLLNTTTVLGPAEPGLRAGMAGAGRADPFADDRAALRAPAPSRPEPLAARAGAFARAGRTGSHPIAQGVVSRLPSREQAALARPPLPERRRFRPGPPPERRGEISCRRVL